MPDTPDTPDVPAALESALSRFRAQVKRLEEAIEAQTLAGISLVAVDIHGNAMTNFLSIHPAITVVLHEGMQLVFDAVEAQLVEDGTMAPEDTRVACVEAEEDDDDDEDETQLEAAPVSQLQ